MIETSSLDIFYSLDNWAKDMLVPPPKDNERYPLISKIPYIIKKMKHFLLFHIHKINIYLLILI